MQQGKGAGERSFPCCLARSLINWAQIWGSCSLATLVVCSGWMQQNWRRRRREEELVRRRRLGMGSGVGMGEFHGRK